MNTKTYRAESLASYRTRNIYSSSTRRISPDQVDLRFSVSPSERHISLASEMAKRLIMDF